MAVTAQGSGTQSTTGNIGTELTLLDVAVAGSFLLKVNKINMIAGDMLELRIYSIILTGGTRAVEYKSSWFDAQIADDMIASSVPVSNELTDAGSLRFTLKQVLGTAHNYDWKVLKFA